MAVTSLASAQVRPPNYSPDAIPETSFTCEDKITGGYYADQEADCQLFHVCVQVSEYEVGPIFLTKVIGSWIRLDIFIRLEIGNKTGISNEMHAYVLREKKKNYLETT